MTTNTNTNTNKPTIVMVPGAWHKPIIYSKVASILQSHGYPTVELPLPSIGAENPCADFTEDVAAIRDRLTALIDDEGKDVVLVVHSYSGLPGGEAPKGLGKRQREEQGLKGGLVRFVVIMGLAVPPGFQATTRGDNSRFPPWMDIDVEKDIVTVSTQNAREIFYHDLPDPAEADEWISKLTHQSLGPYFSTTTYAVWQDVPSTYVIGEKDRSAVGEMVEPMLLGARQLTPSAFDVVERCEGGHCMMVSMPEWTADVLRRTAGEEI